MRINDFEKMQQNLNQMKQTLNSIEKIELNDSKKKKAKLNFRERRVAEKQKNRISNPRLTQLVKDEQIIFKTTIAIVAVTFVFSTSIFAKTIVDNSNDKSENSIQEISIQTENREVSAQNEKFNVENNENAIQLEDILLENVSVLKSKEYTEEIRDVDFEIEYNENSKLPEGEQIIVEEGKKGQEQVSVIKSFENNNLVAENILESTPIEEPVKQKVDVGTSKFLAENKVHISDTMYLTQEIKLLSSKESGQEICTILESLDVTLVDLENEDWCKVEYDGLEGYVKSKYLTSSKVTPEIIDANRRQRIKMSLTEDIQLNKSTDLTLEDYKKVLQGNSLDKNNIISDNAEVFYNIDKNYNMNGLFLAAMAIHESGWGTSTISKDKKNLFGYGAYDSSPYSSSFSFDTYQEGIETVAKVLVKYYINEEGTKIYDDEIAKGSYYNEPTISGVNTRYASDTNWHNKIYSYMEYLYNRL